MLRLTRDQVRQIDRLAAEKFKIPGVVLMENAARAAADVAMDMLGSKPGQALTLCGGGNNGGDGLAVARHLHNRGVALQILLAADPGKYQNEALINYQIVTAMGLPCQRLNAADLKQYRPSLIIDAIFGTGLTEPPRPPFAQIVEAVASLKTPVLAIDIPSGLDCDTGQPLGPTIKATRTITFVAEKTGFARDSAKEYLGQVTVGDIGCPKELIHE